MLKTRLGRRGVGMVVAAATGLGASVAAAPPAHAGLLSPSSCPADSSLTQPFKGWGDTNAYRLVPNGDFSAGASGWTLSGRASVVSDGPSFDLADTSSGHALSLPAGASAQSPFTCIDVSQPTIRFVGIAGGPLSTTLVSVVFKEPVLGSLTLPIGVLLPGGSWQPSPQYQNGALVGGLLTGGTAQMAVRLTALTGATRIDDVFVDPRMSWGG